MKSKKLEVIYGAKAAEQIADSQVLVVGAGGIGCELVKCLSMTGFRHIKVIDLDTIDVSNLNRQFLFRREHVGLAKSTCLRQAISQQNPDIMIESFEGRIQQDNFGQNFFSQFNIVFNALDNIDARNHVNQMCFNLGIPLLEAGTEGYKASMVPILKNVTQCYQCIKPKQEQSFPMCTIRQKPDKIIHCIQWAKALFEGLYGQKDQQNIIEDIIKEITESRTTGNVVSFVNTVVEKMFWHEPNQVKLSFQGKLDNSEKQIEATQREEDTKLVLRIKPIKLADFLELTDLPETVLNDDENLSQQVLRIDQYLHIFVRTVKQIENTRKDNIGKMMFDKDDDLALEFVVAASNIRSYNFSIQMETAFKIKEMAGKIVPAISSSNALVASLQVHEAVKLLQRQSMQLRGFEYNRVDKKERFTTFIRSTEQANPDCPVCRDDSMSLWVVTVPSFANTTLKQLIDEILPQKLGVSNQKFSLWHKKDLFFEKDDEFSEDEFFARKLERNFLSLKLQPDTIVGLQASLIEKPDQQLNFEVQLAEDVRLSSPEAKQLKKGFYKPQVQKVVAKPQDNQVTRDVSPDMEFQISDEDDVQIMPRVGEKRESPQKLQDDQVNKRQRLV